MFVRSWNTCLFSAKAFSRRINNKLDHLHCFEQNLKQSFQTIKFWLIIFVGYDEDKAIFSTGSELGTVAILCSLFSYWVCMVLVLPEKPFFLVFQFLQSYNNLWRLWRWKQKRNVWTIASALISRHDLYTTWSAVWRGKDQDPGERIFLSVYCETGCG